MRFGDGKVARGSDASGSMSAGELRESHQLNEEKGGVAQRAWSEREKEAHLLPDEETRNGAENVLLGPDPTRKLRRLSLPSKDLAKLLPNEEREHVAESTMTCDADVSLQKASATLRTSLTRID